MQRIWLKLICICLSFYICAQTIKLVIWNSMISCYILCQNSGCKKDLLFWYQIRPFKKAINTFEHTKIAESIEEGVVKPYYKTTMSGTNSDGCSRKIKCIPASSKTNSTMGYLRKACGTQTMGERHIMFLNLVLKGKLRESVQLICEREKRRVLQPD